MQEKEQKSILNIVKRTPHPIKLGPMSFNSTVLNPRSPIPTKVKTIPGIKKNEETFKKF